MKNVWNDEKIDTTKDFEELHEKIYKQVLYAYVEKQEAD